MLSALASILTGRPNATQTSLEDEPVTRPLGLSLPFSSALIVALAALGLNSCATHSAEPEAAAAHAEHPKGHGHTHAPRRVIPEGAGAPLFNDLGDFQRDISSTNELAKKYFRQGLILAYGFNHAEASRSFAEAYAQDPSCGICAWGEALVLGPNINKPMDPADNAKALDAVGRAVAAGSSTATEKALIDALATRYSEDTERGALDLAYADAMRGVAAANPDDADVQSLFAEALMDTMPWDYWIDPATPKPETSEVLAALERAMAIDHDHPGALHLYIHAVEPSDNPSRGEQAADLLGPLSPGAGHLVHMPSHIYLRVGRYHDASVANEKAASADESYITQCRAQGFYPAAYYPHNVHFLYASAAFEGRSAVSIGAAKKLSANMTDEVVTAVPIVEEFVPMELYALARFGRWQELLAAPAPREDWRYARGAWHFTRGMAYAATGRSELAGVELATLRDIAGEPELAELYFASGSTPAQLLSIGVRVLEARQASEAGDFASAVSSLKEAVEQQDALPYTEPPPWYFPTREALGEALLGQGNASEAEAVFRKQLNYTPRNGWSQFGLAASLRAQNNTEAAATAEAELKELWERADISLEAAVF